MVLDEGIAQPVLLGPKHVIAERASEYHLDLSRVEVVNPVESPDLERYCEELVKLRQRRGVTPQLSRKIMSRRNPYGMMMVHLGEADGVVSGLNMSYPETIRPALQIIGIRPDVKRAAGMYMMVKPGDEVRFFADATVNLDPDEEALAEIAIQCADAVRELGITPRVAMLSFSNFGSVSHPEAGRAARAVDLVRARRPDIEIDGEMQADTAVNRARFGAMFPFCRLTDSANVLIFPNLAAGNVAYKLVAELGGAEAVGPILLGLRRPVTVLQHESTVDQIVNMTAFTAVTATGGFDRAAAAAAHLRVPAKR
jgi:malate dehydrogenase (oxaloacetate-decarboxylating)(NADP+)